MTWAKILAGKASLADALASGDAVTNDQTALTRFFACFDLASLHN